MRFVWVLNLNRQLSNSICDINTPHLLVYRFFVNRTSFTKSLGYGVWGLKYYCPWKLNPLSGRYSRSKFGQRSIFFIKRYNFSSHYKITPDFMYISSVSYNHSNLISQNHPFVINTLLLQLLSRELYIFFYSIFYATFHFVSLFCYDNQHNFNVMRNIGIPRNPHYTTFRALRYL
jgi:hypothetical protein